jgi:tRNA(Ile)-lysidine synthase
MWGFGRRAADLAMLARVGLRHESRDGSPEPSGRLRRLGKAVLPPLMSLLPLESRFAASWPPESWHDVTVVAAVSGGADSVAMLRAVATLKTGGRGRLIVAHFNHKLRPEADEDARFVAELAERLQLPCELGEGCVAETAAAVGDGLEAAARHQRYAFLQSTAERLGARYVVTAHTADDQAETILHRILRGTGIGGLAGMRRARPLGAAVTLIRPLLDIRRSDVVAYLDTLKQPYREDASNSNLDFTRNRIRHSLLPLLAANYNADVVAALLRLGQTARDAQQFIDSDVEELLGRVVVPSDIVYSSRSAVRNVITAERDDDTSADGMTINCSALAGVNRHIVRELFVALWRARGWPQQSMGFAEWDALAVMALENTATPQQRVFPGNTVAQRTGERLTLARLPQSKQFDVL